MSEPQRALLSTITSGRSAVDKAQNDLSVKAQLPPLGADPASVQWKQNTMDVKKQSVSSQLAAMNAATEQVITLTSGPPEEVDHPAVGAAVTTITTNLSEMSKDVKMIAALMDDDLQGENLLYAARNLCAAFYDLLKAAEPETKEPRQNLLNAAGRVGEASHAVLRNIGEEDAIDKEIQDILLGLAKRVGYATANLVLKAKNVASKCDDQAHQNKVITAATQCALTTSKLVASAKVVAPTITNPSCQQQLIEAAKEVSRAVEGINKACSGATRDENLLKDMHLASNQVEDALNELIHHIRTVNKQRAQASVHDGAVDTILDATDRLFNSSGDAGEMVLQAKILATATATLVQAIKGEADSQTDSDIQKRLLAAAKVLADATARMVEAAKGCAFNPHDSASQAALQKAAEDLRSATNAAANNALKRKLIRRLEEVADVLSKLVQGVKSTMMDVDNPSSQLALISSCESMLTATHIHCEIDESADGMKDALQDLLQTLEAAATEAGVVTGLVDSINKSIIKVANRININVQDLGRACIDLARAAGSCQSNPTDTYSQRDVSDNARMVTEKVSFVLAALQAGSHGTQACINAASTVSGIIGDLDTTIMFATAGALHAENENETLSDHRENILITAKALVEDTKTLVAGVASSQEQLAVAAQNAVTTIIQLAEVVKLGAASLGSNNPEAQVLLINAVKDVATALGDLDQATKAASGKSIHDPAMIHLRDSAKVMVTNVTSLLKTVTSVEDEHSRGTRALESTIEAIGQEIRAYDSNDPPMRSAIAEDLLRATKPVTLATAKVVAAGNSCKQDDIIVAANMGRKAIFDLLMVSKAAAFTSETTELRTRTLQSGHNCAVHYRELLQMVHHVIQKPTHDGKQQLATVSRTIAQSVQDVVSCAESLKGSDWEDPDNRMVIAETELNSAVITIDAAAKKLANLKPRMSKHHETGLDETMNFDEMILEAAKSIAAVTSALVKAASATQRELVAAGKVGAHPVYTSDDGQWSEGLISAQTGNAVKKATREEIIRKERELEVAREKLTALRKAKYGNRSPDDYQGYGFPWNLFF